MTRPVTATAHVREPADFHDPETTAVYTIAKQFSFEASHQLPGLPDGHKCGRMHGHSYTAEVVLTARVLRDPGFVMDFGDLKPVGAYLDTVADHRTLNDLIPNPTSENLARHLYTWVLDNLTIPNGVILEKVRISETATSWAEYTGATA
jgi:6-pyruvoyltetrahydropterin/6-carboxytetrahydropterin synthase